MKKSIWTCKVCGELCKGPTGLRNHYLLNPSHRPVKKKRKTETEVDNPKSVSDFSLLSFCPKCGTNITQHDTQTGTVSNFCDLCGFPLHKIRTVMEML
jgi:hypothetical protein